MAGKTPGTSTPLAPFRVLGAAAVNRREHPGDSRLYYCDQDIDVVVTTMRKRHVEPPHKHRRNTESYYVVRGSLIMHVEGAVETLGEGDMMVIPPGVCHSFETTDEEVCFLAIKKIPLLKDKQPCP